MCLIRLVMKYHVHSEEIKLIRFHKDCKHNLIQSDSLIDTVTIVYWFNIRRSD